ncbi:hypothetical protein [Halorientalis persicus]|uniref:hypothetical protein n=1 Tax=Halorientalis persicus TaxID=1367881 RepID=UPI0011139B2D|nr:hypothetical protein [Halorientalis persicus]
MTVAFDGMTHSSALGFEGERGGLWVENGLLTVGGRGRDTELVFCPAFIRFIRVAHIHSLGI